jgi:hypothetical protein
MKCHDCRNAVEDCVCFENSRQQLFAGYNNTATVIKAYKEAKANLLKYKADTLKPGEAVIINSERFKGQAVVRIEDNCPVDQVAVQLENGNVWWYNTEDCLNPSVYGQ